MTTNGVARELKRGRTPSFYPFISFLVSKCYISSRQMVNIKLKREGMTVALYGVPFGGRRTTNGVARGLEKGRRIFLSPLSIRFIVSMFIFLAENAHNEKKKRWHCCSTTIGAVSGCRTASGVARGQENGTDPFLCPFIPLSLSECLDFLIDKSST